MTFHGNLLLHHFLHEYYDVIRCREMRSQLFRRAVSLHI